MEQKLPKFLYRSVKLEYLDLYISNPSAIPYLEGKCFKQFSHLNPYPYEDETRYMHFFDRREMAKGYAIDSSINGKYAADHVVCVFQFPDEILREHRTDGLFGFYTKSGRDAYEMHNEYIIPADLYVPEFNFVGVLERSQLPEPNVYAVVNRAEIESYATDLSQAGGCEYLGEYPYLDSYVKGKLDAGTIVHGSQKLSQMFSHMEEQPRAIELFSSKQAAINSLNSHFSYNPQSCAGWSGIKIMDVISGVNAVFANQNAVIPFYIAPEILEQFKIGESPRGGFEYLVPLECLSEENYFETGNDWITEPEKYASRKKSDN